MKSLYDSMMISLGDANTGAEEGPVTVEIAERECVTERSIFLRVAFQDGLKLEEIEFRTPEQLLTVGKAILKYADSHASISQLLK